jgi:hypothetical protein
MPIEIDEVPVMQFQYIPYLILLLFLGSSAKSTAQLLLGSNSYAEVASQQLLFIPLGMRDFMVAQHFFNRAHDAG